MLLLTVVYGLNNVQLLNVVYSLNNVHLLNVVYRFDSKQCTVLYSYQL